MTRRYPAGVLLAVIGLSTGCVAKSPESLPSPPTTRATTTTAAAVDAPPVALAAVPGRTTTTVALAPGSATLSGTVTANGGVGGATVRVERFVGDAMSSTTVTSDPAGHFVVPNIKGGRYRVRAWRVPDMAQSRPEIFFLGSTEKREINLKVDSYSGRSVSVAVAPNPPVKGQSANLVVQVTEVAVNGNGVVRPVNVPGAGVNLTLSGALKNDSPSFTVTDASGRATYRTHCADDGTTSAIIVVDGQSFSRQIVSCAVPASTTTEGTVTVPYSSSTRP